MTPVPPYTTPWTVDGHAPTDLPRPDPLP